MRLCYHCGRETPGSPLFCNHCGRSYNIKFCPRNHPNPRGAEACSVCGSRDLSIPQGKPPFWFRPLLLLANAIVGSALLFISLVYLAYFVRKLFSDPSGLLPSMLVGLFLGLIWLLWMHVPIALVRQLRRSRLRRRG